MQRITLPHSQTKLFSTLVIDYLAGADSLRPFYKYPHPVDFAEVIKEKSEETINRKVLVDVLKEQYKEITTSESVAKNISSLEKETTFTVTTGHQLCLFTGPLYFIYKTIHAINLAEELKAKHPENDFVPVFWLASEDHGLKEADHINLFGKTLRWHPEEKGAFGRLHAVGMQHILQELDHILGKGESAEELRALFNKAYDTNNTIAEATRHILNALFGKYGLVVLNPDNTLLKREFASIVQEDIIGQASGKLVEQTTKELAKHYKPQIELQGINFFYLNKGFRERIILEDGKYKVNKTDIIFLKEELVEEIEQHPERFSPNVAMRPLYQEKILPNLVYLGGPAEVAYWLQLKEVFEHYKINYPVVMLRNSALFIDEKTQLKMKKLGMEPTSLFNEDNLKEEEKDIKKKGNLDPQRKQIEEAYLAIQKEAEMIEKSLEKTVKGALKKQMDQLDNLEKKLQNTFDRQNENSEDQKIKLRHKLFPAGAPQERYDNFIPFYLQYGNKFISVLKENLFPLEQQFTIVVDN